MEDANERLRQIYICFADVAKAYDSVLDYVLQLALRRIGMKTSEIRLMLALYQGREMAILSHLGFQTEWFRMMVGITQGSVLGPTLYKILISIVGVIIMGLVAEHGYSFAEGAKALAQFFADDLGTEEEQVDALSHVFLMIGEFYSFARKSLHPDKFVLQTNCEAFRLRQQVGVQPSGSVVHGVIISKKAASV